MKTTDKMNVCCCDYGKGRSFTSWYLAGAFRFGGLDLISMKDYQCLQELLK